ncbi:MAG: EthD family reductase, partial [Gammaproteobacteria bacterium]
PKTDSSSFDMDYYCNSHIPMVREKCGATLKNVAVEGGLGGGAPDSPPPYAAMGHLYFDSVEEFQSSFGPHAEAIMADIPNYTNVQPVIQVSEIQI